MLQDDNLDVQELEHRYPSSPPVLWNAIVLAGYLAFFLVLGCGAVGVGAIIAHFIIKAW